MNKVALNFICKNEAHIIGRMLTSSLPIIEMIVGVDTGSSDDTISIISQFGMNHNIPTFIFQRPFDNFCNSRNYALKMLKEKASELGWDLNTSWGFTVDCDELVKIEPSFKKDDLTADYYAVRQRIGRETFTRHGLYRLSKDIYWESPIHETLVYTDPKIVKQYEFKIEIIEEPLGASWKGDVVGKFLGYASMLDKHIREGHRNFRAVYFLGDSYNAAAYYCKDQLEATRLYKLAEKHFNEALTLEAKNPEVRFMLFKKIAENKQALHYPWHNVKREYINAFLEYPLKAESLAPVIEHYIDYKEWELAYYYSRFCYKYFVQNPKPDIRVHYNDESLYQWRLLFCYYFTAYKSGRIKEAQMLFSHLLNIKKEHPEYFSDEDLILIKLHTPIALKITGVRQRIRAMLQSLNLLNNENTKFSASPLTEKSKKIHYAA
ncbi:glycosyltransferase family protein [Chitinophaga tropicalis]|uniref:Glycosyltransferase 2-like domain-containing protein n=1 Tax=Chitinophaga tropicalis TaxID=2683588 RepID=A0A7K1TZY0_9BACT|nr:hypothetical protein [Chitinophaga tropicalis]MVT07668.1 hypothetical protein [Chitinophaga tropicalis]